MASVSDWNATPCAFRSSSKAMEVTQRPAQPVELPDRQHTTGLKSLRHFSSAGRLVFVPVAVSVNILSHPPASKPSIAGLGFGLLWRLARSLFSFCLVFKNAV